MSDLNKEYKKIVKEIEGIITDKEEFELTKNKIAELSLLFVDVIDRVTDLADHKLEQIEENQKEMEKRLERLSAIVDGIERDIYEDENMDGFDFEIVCPYCNHEFVADIDFENKRDIECPECHNMIELDFNTDEGCSGDCLGCHEHYEDEKKSPNEDEDM